MMQSPLKKYLLTVMAFLFMALPVLAKEKHEKVFTVVVDAGHGGKDIGATDNKAKEKDINLGVALQLQKLIKKKLKNAKVVMTRDDDTYLTLQQRADVANKAKGDLFISIHTNSLDKSNKNRKTVSGSSVYALGLHKDENNMRVARRENSVIELEQNYEQKYSGFDPSKDESYIIFEMAQKKNLSKSIKFAEEAQKQLVKSGRANRGVHQAGFWVLWATSMPSVLIELDFICNPKSASYLTSEKGEKELAQAIFKAVSNYHENWLLSTKGNLSYGDKLSESGLNDDGNDGMAADRDEDGCRLVLASSRSDVRKVTEAPSEGVNQGYAVGKRRRRSASSRRTSSLRNVETQSIPLHSESERLGKVVDVRVSNESDIVASVDSDNVSKKDKKKNKKEKKAEKERKKKEKQKKSTRPASAHSAKIDKFVTVYKIQVLASADLLKQNNPRFCGLAPITTYKENNLYKYYYGESLDRGEIDEMLKAVKKKIPDAFIISSVKSMSSAKN